MRNCSLWMATTLGVTLILTASTAHAQTDRRTHMNLAWSPNGKTIAFSAYINFKPRFFLIDAAGGAARALDTAPEKSNNPNWSTDGKRILFNAAVDSQAELFSMRRDGRDVRRLSYTAVSESGTAWSRTGVAFTAKLNGKRALWIANAADGSNAKPIASNPQLDFYNPSWSPDGTRLTFYSDAGDHKDQIWTVNADGTNLRRVTDGRFHNTFPSWSPKGNRLLYTQETEASEKRTGQLISVAVDGSDAQVLATDSVFLGVWSPKGNRIAYTRFDSANVTTGFQTELVVMDADGKNRRVIHH